MHGTYKSVGVKSWFMMAAAIAVAALAIVLLAGCSSSKAASSNTAASSSAASAADTQTTDSATSSASASASASTTLSPTIGAMEGNGNPKWVDVEDCWNDEVPSLYGLANLTGQELASMLPGHTFEFSESSNMYLIGEVATGGVGVRFANGNSAYKPSAIKALDSIGVVSNPLEINLMINEGVEDLVDDSHLMFRCSRVTEDDDMFIGIAKDSLDNDILVLGVVTSKGYTEMMLFNEAYIQNGYLDDLIEDATTRTPDDIQDYWDVYMDYYDTGWKK